MRGELVAAASPAGAVLIARLGHALDEVRREWIAADEAGWIALHAPYGSVDELRRLVAEPGRSVLETARAVARADSRIRLLTLEQFRQGTAVWP